MQLRLAVLLLSAAAIAHEILLIRLFSIIQWHRFAFTIISLALLGYGASGAFLTLARRRLERRFGAAFVLNAALFSLLAVATFAAAQRFPFNPLEAVWNPRQLYYLVLLYLLLAVPFFCAANSIGLALTVHREDLHRIYRADLLGAGLGAAGIVAALFLLPPERCLAVLGAVGLAAAALACLDPRVGRPRLAAVLALAAPAFPFLWPAAWLEPRLSEYKQLSKALLVPGTEILARRSSPLGLLTAVRSPTIPLRHAAGLSLAYDGELPEQIGVFTDGDSMTAIDRAAAGDREAGYLDYLPSALPYHLGARPRVLVLGAGGGSEVRAALAQGARSVDAVEYDPRMVELVESRFADFSGHLYGAPEVRVHVAEGRSFVAAGSARYDLIQLTLVDSLAAAAAGVHAISEGYLYTVEAFQDYLGSLDSRGLLTISRWLTLPPRDSLKLFATAVEALERLGIEEPGAHLALVRSWASTTLLVGRDPFSPAELTALRRFCARRFFDLDWYPGMTAGDATGFNLLQEPYLRDGAAALLGAGREEFLARYKFDLRPATDDRPYFFHFFKWRSLPELLALRQRGGTPLVEWSYLLLLATLAQAVLAGALVILVPLAAGGARDLRHPGAARVAIYFACLGFAFLLLEIAFIQRFTLFLGHPLFAVAVVLAAFLVFAGLGSGASRRLEERRSAADRLQPISRAALAVVALALLYLLALPPLLGWAMPLPGLAKLAVAAALIAPLAFAMGMPFPLGLARAEGARPAWGPWAWGINGWASVVGAIAAPVIAIHCGFTTVVMAAAALYATAAAAMARLPR